MIGHDAAIGILAVINKGWFRKRSHPFFVRPVYCCARMVLFAEDVVSLSYHRARWRGKMVATGRDFPAKVWPSAF